MSEGEGGSVGEKWIESRVTAVGYNKFCLMLLGRDPSSITSTPPRGAGGKGGEKTRGLDAGLSPW